MTSVLESDAVARRIAALPPRQRALLAQRLRRERAAAAAVRESWFVRFRPVPAADLRLFCFGYAGGGASAFRTWPGGLPGGVEVCAVQLPGHESRIREAAHRHVGPLVSALAEVIEPLLDRPFAFFGHSMGALIAFELARQLRRTSRPQPVRLAPAAFRAPQLPNPNIRIHHLPEEMLTVVLRGEGVPEQVLQSAELMAALLPTLRADLELCDTYTYRDEAPLGYPLSIFGGVDDIRVAASDLQGWRDHTTAGAACRCCPDPTSSCTPPRTPCSPRWRRTWPATGAPHDRVAERKDGHA